MWKIKSLLIFSLVLYSSWGWGTIGFNDAAFPELVTSGRALAMGNAYTSKADDSNSVFYNPAGLGTFRKWHFHFSNLNFESNKDLFKMTGGRHATDATSNIIKAYKLDGTRQMLLENPGRFTHARLSAFPNITSRFFSMGYMYSFQQRAHIGATANAKFEYATRQDHGPVVSLAAGLWGGVLKFGVSAIYLNRSEAIGEADSSQTFNVDDHMKKGSMMYLVGGSRLTLPTAWLPTLSAVIHNASNGRFKPTATAPDKARQNVVYGFSLTPQVGRYMRIHMEANYKDAFDKYGVEAARRLGLGLEIDMARTFFFRLGYGDGFGSAGIGIKSRILEVDLTTYAVDTTTNEFRGKEDRRFVLSVSRGF